MKSINNKKTALFFIQDGIGGAEKVQTEIAKMLLSTDWEITMCKVCYKKPSSNITIEKFYPNGIDNCQIIYNSQISLIKKIYREIKRRKPDVVFSSVMNLSRPLLILHPIIRNVKIIIRCNNYLYTVPHIKRFFTVLCYRFADIIISQTEEMEDELKNAGINKSKIRTIHNPLDKGHIILKAKSSANPYSTNKINYVAVGRFAYQKGFDILVKAFNIVLKNNLKAHLTIIGNYEYGNQKVYNSLISFIRKQNICSSITFTGQLENPYPYMLNADAFVLSSRWEGLPNTLIESQLLGTPAAATKCIPIIERIVSSGINGYLCDTESPEELANAMIKTIELNRIKITYQPGEESSFIDIFNSILTNNKK